MLEYEHPHHFGAGGSGKRIYLKGEKMATQTPTYTKDELKLIGAALGTHGKTVERKMNSESNETIKEIHSKTLNDITMLANKTLSHSLELK